MSLQQREFGNKSMTFPTVVFGSYEVGIGYTDGASISTGGLRVFVVPTKNVTIPLDVGITYIDQFGNTKTTMVTTSIPTATGGGTTGAHFQIVLNAGDSGIRDIISISVVGGAVGDKFNLESWNEGLGRSAYNLTRSDPNPVWIETEPKKETINFSRTFSSWLDFSNTIQTDIVISGYPDSQISLPIEIIEPDYTTDVHDFGFMQPNTTITKDGINKKLRIDLKPTTSYQYIDNNEQSARLKWKWNPSLSQYEDVGFYKLTFDYDVQFNTNFIFELLDKNGTVVWSKTVTGTGINQIVSFKSFSWEFRLRCKTSYTTLAVTTDHAQISNIRIERYKDSGVAELNYVVDMPNIYRYDSVDVNSITPSGTGASLQLAFSDDGSTWSNFIGPDNTSLTYFEGIGQHIADPLPIGLTGYYYTWAVYLASDGRDTPIIYDITLYMITRITPRLLDIEIIPSDIYLPANPKIKVPIVINTACPRATPGYPPPCPGGDYISEPTSGNQYTKRTYPYIRLCPRTTPGYPTPQCPGGDYVYEQPSGRQMTARRLSILKTWLESVVGQVISGYVHNLNDEVIRNAFSMVLMSTEPTEITPGGLSAVMNVNPDTGLYQAFLKQVIYDQRYLIIKIGLKNVALEGAGTPPFIDGSQKLDIPYNLQFSCPVIDCDFNITRKV